MDCTKSIARVYSSLPRHDGVCMTSILVINPERVNECQNAQSVRESEMCAPTECYTMSVFFVSEEVY